MHHFLSLAVFLYFKPFFGKWRIFCNGRGYMYDPREISVSSRATKALNDKCKRQTRPSRNALGHNGVCVCVCVRARACVHWDKVPLILYLVSIPDCTWYWTWRFGRHFYWFPFCRRRGGHLIRTRLLCSLLCYRHGGELFIFSLLYDNFSVAKTI
jgi:hypothetical protein